MVACDSQAWLRLSSGLSCPFHRSPTWYRPFWKVMGRIGWSARCKGSSISHNVKAKATTCATRPAFFHQRPDFPCPESGKKSLLWHIHCQNSHWSASLRENNRARPPLAPAGRGDSSLTSYPVYSLVQWFSAVTECTWAELHASSDVR